MEAAGDPPAAAIIGPTAGGKSELALAVAGALNAEIISVDSGAVYRGMDIGTATPTPAMQAQVPHHLVNIVNPDDPYNVARFYHDAVAAAQHIRQKGKTPLFVGGSMMYFNALINGLTALPPVPADITRRTRAFALKHGAAALYKKLQQEDPQTAAAVAPTDTQRLIRAYDLALNQTPLSTHPQKKHPPLPLKPLILLPDQRIELRQRIAQRLQAMWQSGLLEETRLLLANWSLEENSAPLKMAGYQQCVEYLRGDYDENTMYQKAYYATSQLAKRQFTWLQKWRSDAAVLDPFTETDLTAAAIAALAAC